MDLDLVSIIFSYSKTSSQLGMDLSTKIKTVFVDKKSSEVRKRSKIDILFSNNVKVTVNDFAKFNHWEFLSEIGGSLGLWLGLGVVQMLECFAERLQIGL